ncbi:hypothetical protein [Sphingomonas sp.]|jgi:hypothetical protein|uniref:hypothetical protein n=1 Tax=Sphingomonas sp. TaxID=28214 RepID=UPI002DF2A8FC|nr:hypothetical protein [Sphingomonas sp.]
MLPVHLCLALGAVGAAAFASSEWSRRSWAASLGRMCAAAPVAAFTSAATYPIKLSGASGTGTRVQHGWPRSFYTRWSDWETGISAEGLSALFYLANSTAHWGVLLLALALWNLLRRPNG